jgi:hypothetical protein
VYRGIEDEQRHHGRAPQLGPHGVLEHAASEDHEERWDEDDDHYERTQGGEDQRRDQDRRHRENQHVQPGLQGLDAEQTDQRGHIELAVPEELAEVGPVVEPAPQQDHKGRQPDGDGGCRGP